MYSLVNLFQWQFCICYLSFLNSILISVFLEYINYAIKEPQPDRLKMDLLLRAMKVCHF